MKKNYSDITLVLDWSGPMASIADESIAGFNEFVENQKGFRRRPQSMACSNFRHLMTDPKIKGSSSGTTTRRAATDPLSGKKSTNRVAALDDPIYPRVWTVGSAGVSRKKK